MNFAERFISKKVNIFLTLVVLSLLVYLPVIRGDYVFDDDIFIVNNQYVHDLNHVKQIYTHSTTDGAGVNGGNFYRPNQSLSHAILYTLFGKSATGQHLFSIFIHILNVCLLFSLLGLLGFSPLPSLIASTVFAVHPINTEAVAYISGLSDPLSMMFILLACICYVGYHREQKIYYFVFTLLNVLLALFTKESSMMLILVLLFIEIYLQAKKISLAKGISSLLILVFFLCAGFLYLKFTVFNFTGNIALTAADNEYTQSIVVRFITFCNVLPRYMGMLIFPVSQYLEKPYTAYITFEALGFGGLMLMGAFTYMFYYSFRSSRVLMLGIGIFFAFLLPVSGIIPTNAIYLEHWLYLPFLGISILIAALFQYAKVKIKPGLFILFGVLILAYSAKTIYRNIQWADAIRFYKNEIKFNKKSARVYNNLAMVLSDKKDYYSAINYYSLAISVYDAYPQTHHNLAQTYLQINQVSSAIAEEYKALEMQPNFMYSLQSLFNIYTKLKDEKRSANFSKFIQEAEQGKIPDWNEIRTSLPADKK